VRPNSSTSVQEPQTFIEAARRAQIVRCAIDTIAELGYARASLAEIAKRAGISKGVISYHFANKDDLIQQIVADAFTTAALYMVPRVHAQSTARDALRAYIESNVAFMGANRKHMIALHEIASGFRDDGGMPRLDRRELEPAADALVELLRHGQATGEFRLFDTRVMAHAIRAAIDDLPARIAAHPDDDIDASAKELADIFDLATKAQRAPKNRTEVSR
jgi:AcrR family transcriptional regulator